MAKIGYARISSSTQNIDRQIQQLEDAGCEKIFFDICSGEILDRPDLNAMRDYLRENDELILPELDRLSRNAFHLNFLLSEIQMKKVTLEILDLPSFVGVKDPLIRTLLTNLIVEIYKYQAENERRKIRYRQQQGIEIAKHLGKYKGRRKKFTLDDPQLLHAIKLIKEGKSVKEVSKLTGIAYATLYRYLKAYK